MFKKIITLAAAALLAAISFTGCDKTIAPPATKLNKANYDQVHTGMTKSQVEALLGSPTSVETKDVLIYKRTTYRYQAGNVFVNLSFKNDELDNKDTNLGTAKP